MRCYTLQREQWLASPLQRIFDYRQQVFTRLFGGKPKTSIHASHVLAREENTA